MNNTVSGFFGGGSFGVGSPEATGSVMVEVGELLSMPRSRKIASRLAYFLASWGSTGSMYLCFLGTVSRGAGLGTIILVTVITPDLEMGRGVADEEAGSLDGAEEVVDVVVDAPSELDLLDELDELEGVGVDVVDDVWERKARAGVFGRVEAARMGIEGREAGGRGLAEAVRGGKIAE